MVTNHLKHINCNICGTDNTAPVATQNNYRFVKCVTCELVYMNPRPELEVLKNIYDTYHQRNGKDEHSWELMMGDNFKSVSTFLLKRFPATGRILDIGCGYGHFLKIMEGHGWKADGIDPSPNTVSYARKEGLDVVNITIDEASLPESSFNAVTMFYVLEHLTDPLNALRKVHHLLVPGGAVIIRVPHTTPVVRLLSFLKISNNLYDAPFHLFDFSPSAITRLLEKSGFTSIKVTPGEPTVPHRQMERLVSLSSGYTAKLLYKLSGGKFLLPGVSKTTIAFNPKDS